MQALPLELVELLDRLYLGERSEELFELWSGFRAQKSDGLEVLFDFSISDEELHLQENLGSQFEQLDRMVESALNDQLELGTLFREMAELCGAIDAFEEGRFRRHFLALPALDQLLCAGVATAQGRGSLGAVWSRLAPARQAVEELKETSRDLADLLPREVREAIDHGLKITAGGFESAQEYLKSEDPELLEKALFQWKSGGEILSELVDFLVDVQRRDQEEQPATPILGELFSAIENDFSEAVQLLFFEDRLPEFLDFWDHQAASLPVEPAVLEELFPRIEELVEELRGLFEIEEIDHEGLIDLLARVDEAFEELRRRRLPMERLYSSSFEPEVELLVGALKGTVPQLVLESAAATMAKPEAPPLIRELSDHLSQFLETGDTLVILNALQRVDEVTQAAQTELPCPHCGQLTSRKLKACSHCHQELPGVEVSA